MLGKGRAQPCPTARARVHDVHAAALLGRGTWRSVEGSRHLVVGRFEEREAPNHKAKHCDASGPNVNCWPLQGARHQHLGRTEASRALASRQRCAHASEVVGARGSPSDELLQLMPLLRCSRRSTRPFLLQIRLDLARLS
eukprot:scaffold494_cov117-Isochrysis_galbana.AAC.11